MIQLALRFPAGRFHATPWGHHVNEGVAEWPPAPWRLLRALVSSLHLGGASGPERNVAYSAVRKLAAPPSFLLPPAVVAHTRHYLALNQIERSKTTLTFDTFVALDPASELVVLWPAALEPEERAALAGLVARVRYLGRAEAWCDMELKEDSATPEPNCVVSDGRAALDKETVRVLCATPEVSEADLERTTAELQRDGWSDPPGTRWVFYHRLADALRSRVTPATVTSPAGETSTVAELALGGPVLPLFTDAVKVAETVRRAALYHHQAPSRTLSGKDTDGRPLVGQHRHAHFVPDRCGTNRVKRVLVWAPEGFTPAEERAIGSISYLRLKDDGGDPINVVFNGAGQPSSFRQVSRLFRRARVWASVTPFVLPRHSKKGRENPEDQLVRELEIRGFPRPVRVRRIVGAALSDPAAGDSGRCRWVEFDLRRRHRWPTTGAFGFEIAFDVDQEGPILLGFGSHYGLGQFEAVG